MPGNPRYRGVYTAAAGLRPEPAASVGAARRAARHRQLHAAVGEIDRGGGQGGASRVLPAGQSDTCAVPERKAKRRMRKAEEFVSRLGIKVRGDGTNEISIAFPNRSRIVGLPHEENDVAGIFQSIVDADRRGVAGGRQAVSGDASDA